MKLVKPRHGIILAGIPSKGAEVTDKLADEWLENGLVTLVDEKPKARRGRPRREPEPEPQAEPAPAEKEAE